MKNNIVIFVILIMALISTNNIAAQKFDALDKSPMDVASYPSAPGQTHLKKVK